MMAELAVKVVMPASEAMEEGQMVVQTEVVTQTERRTIGHVCLVCTC